MKKLIISCALALATVFAHADNVLKIHVGEIEILRVGDVERVAVGNANLMSTSLLENGQLLVIGEQPGVTTLHIWFADGSESDRTVQIEEADVEAMKRRAGLEARAGEVRTLFAGVDGMTVRVVGEKIVLSGAIDGAHAPSIETVAGAYSEIMDLTRKDRLLLPSDKMVLMNIKITEFSRNVLENLGVFWQRSISGPSGAGAAEFGGDRVSVLGLTDPSGLAPVPGALSGSGFTNANAAFGFFGIATQIASRIDFAVDSGDALVLAQPRLVARSGGKAEFLAGGEIPIRIVNNNVADVEFKPFGISMEIEPTVDDDDNIIAIVNTELSTVDFANTVEDIPSFLVRRTGTDVRMRSGETLVISGLVDYEASKAVSKVKYLGDIPILGALFRSKNFRDKNTELVIFVTPSVVDASAASNQEAIERQKATVDRWQELIGESSLDILD